MNKAAADYYDKKNNYGCIFVNGQRVGIAKMTYGYNKKGFAIRHYVVILANNWNMSNRITFHARTIKGLVGQIERHEYTLVKP